MKMPVHSQFAHLSNAADLAFIAVVNLLGRIVVEELTHITEVPRELNLALLVDADLPNRLKQPIRL